MHGYFVAGGPADGAYMNVPHSSFSGEFPDGGLAPLKAIRNNAGPPPLSTPS